MLKNWLKGTTALIAVGTIVGSNSDAIAQNASGQDQTAEADSVALEEIVVTSRRRSELMQDVPISIAAVTRLEMDRSGFDDIADLSVAVPNFTFQDRGSINGNFGMRGITTNATLAGVESAMAVYVDGILIGRPQAFDATLQGVEQVEVLRGPQGTLFGKNTVAGAINITTRRPTDRLEGRMKVEGGRFDRGMAEGSLNVPISENTMIQMSLSATRQDGWIRNLNDDRKFNGENKWAGRFQVLSRPAENVEIYWSVDRFFDDRNFIIQIPDDPDDLKSNPLADPFNGIVDIDSLSISKRDLWGTSLEINVDTDGGYTVTAIGGFRQTNIFGLTDGDGQFQQLSDNRLKDNTNQWTGELRLASPLGGKFDWIAGAYWFKQNINSSTATRFFPKNILAGCNQAVDPNIFRGALGKGAFFTTSQFLGFDDSGLPLWEFDFDNDGIFGEVADVTTPAGGGGITINENIGCNNPDLIAFSRFLAGGQAEDIRIAAFDGLISADDVPDIAQVVEFGSVNTKAYALFLHGNFHISEKLTLSGGVRHTWENKTVDITQEGMINLPRPTFQKTDGRKDREWSGTGSLTYEFNDEITSYFKFSHGFKSGGFQFDITQGENVSQFNNLLTKSPFVPLFLKANPGATKQDVIDAAIAASADPNVAPNNVEFEPENVNVYEIGLKSELFDRRVRLNLAGFYTDYNNVQQNILNLDTGIIVLNVPGATIKGFEADIVARLGEGFTFNGGVGLAKSKIKNALVICSGGETPTGGTCAGGAPPLVDTSAFLGLRLAQSPQVTANAAVTYRMAVGNSGAVVIRSEWTYMGSIFHELDPNPAQRAKVFEPSYNLVNARIGYVSDANDWEVFFWGRNLFDQEYASFRRANPIMRNFGVPAGGPTTGVPPQRFPGAATGQVVPGIKRTWGLTLQKRF